MNCETANLNKIVNASVNHINDIKLIQNLKKFEELPEDWTCPLCSVGKDMFEVEA